MYKALKKLEFIAKDENAFKDQVGASVERDEASECHEFTISILPQAKDLWAVGEKQRQKQWQLKKIKELKETAIRGLEPHLDNLNDVLIIRVLSILSPIV